MPRSTLAEARARRLWHFRQSRHLHARGQRGQHPWLAELGPYDTPLAWMGRYWLQDARCGLCLQPATRKRRLHADASGRLLCLSCDPHWPYALLYRSR